MNTIRYRIAIIVLCFLLIVSFGLILKQSIKMENIDEDTFTYYANSLNTIYLNESIDLSSLIVYYADNPDSIFFLSSQSPALVCYFTDRCCNSCIDFALEKINNNFSPQDFNGEVILLGYNIDPRLANSYYGKKMLLLKSKLEFSKVHYQPVFFLHNQYNSSNLFFIPDKRHPELTNMYLKIIAGRLRNI